MAYYPNAQELVDIILSGNETDEQKTAIEKMLAVEYSRTTIGLVCVVLVAIFMAGACAGIVFTQITKMMIKGKDFKESKSTRSSLSEDEQSSPRAGWRDKLGVLKPRLLAGKRASKLLLNDQALLDTKPTKVPKHVAVIMDGNRRFGRETKGDALQGHWAGGQTLVDFAQWCMEDGVEMLTVYAFSTENWNRDASEVSALMTIFAKYTESFKQEALARRVHVRVFSTDFEKLPAKVQSSVRDLESSTAQFAPFPFAGSSKTHTASRAVSNASKDKDNAKSIPIPAIGCETGTGTDDSAVVQDRMNDTEGTMYLQHDGPSCTQTDAVDGSEFAMLNAVDPSDDEKQQQLLQQKQQQQQQQAEAHIERKDDGRCSVKENVLGGGGAGGEGVQGEQGGVGEAARSTGGGSFTLNICLSYGSRSEIVSSCRDIVGLVKAGALEVDEIDEELFSNHLQTRGIPDPDILVRTSGEYRLSNFLLWQLAYTELFFVDKYWPQLTRLDLRRILHQFAASRNRRYGK